MLAILAVILLALPAVAQGRIWIVDAAGNGHFRDLPAAVTAASPDDTLLVRAGSYSGFTAAKPLKVIGAGTARNQVRVVAAGSEDAITIRVADGERFDLARIRVEFGPGQGGIRLCCTGAVAHLQDCEVEGAPGFSQIERAAITAFGPRLLSVTGSRVHGRPGIFVAGNSVTASTVSICGSIVSGAGGIRTSKGSGWPASPALYVTLAWVSCSRSSLFGGSTEPPYQPWGSAPAIRAVDTHLWIGGRPTDVIQSTHPGSGPAQPAVDAALSIVTREPLVRLVPTLGAPEIANARRIDARRVLNVCAFAGVVAGALLVEVNGRAGDPFLVALDRARIPVPSPYGPLGIDLATAILSGLALHPPTEIHRFSIPIPPAPELLGAAVALQGIGWNSTLPGIDLSNLGMAVLH